jgi:hypothetical protein
LAIKGLKKKLRSWKVRKVWSCQVCQVDQSINRENQEAIYVKRSWNDNMAPEMLFRKESMRGPASFEPQTGNKIIFNIDNFFFSEKNFLFQKRHKKDEDAEGA